VSAPRVAYVLRAFPRLSETFILHELLALKARGVDVRVFAFEKVEGERMHPAAAAMLSEVTFVKATEPANWRGPSVVPAKQRRWAHAGRQIGLELKAWGATHVHAHFAGPAATAACFAAETAGVTFSFTAHAKDIFVDSLDWNWLSWLGAQAHAVVTVCDYNRRFLRRRMPDARIVRIYNGVDLERWAPPARRAANGPLVTVGRFVRKKGFDILVEAIALLRDRGLPMKAVMIGDGAEHEAVKARAKALKLGRLVRFPGALTHPEVMKVMRGAALVALPCIVDTDGNQDALPTVLLEAAASGLPAVATRVAGVPEIVKDGVTGRVVRPSDAQALADAIANMMKSSRRRALMGTAARRRAERMFDQRRASQALARLFSESCRLVVTSPRLQESIRAHRTAVL
jgi:colanic acid/amylovoran biosynthesis glycosyltransferase